jgi:hypothetical protein
MPEHSKRSTTLRARLDANTPDLVVELFLYPTKDGGRKSAITMGWGCPCSAKKTLEEAWDGYPLLDRELAPGERRRVGFVFLSGDTAVSALKPRGRFYLSEGQFIGEAKIVADQLRTSVAPPCGEKS